MRKPLLATIQNALGEMGQNRPQVVVSSTDKEAQQMFSLLTALCDELAGQYDWEELLTSYTFTTLPGQNAYRLPADCLRIVNQTIWDQTTQEPVYGPRSNASWAVMKSGLGANPVRTNYRLQGGSLVLLPTPTAVHTLSFEYISAKYVLNAGDNIQKMDFTNDADGFVFEDRLITNGLKLKYLESKGLDTSAALSDYNIALDSAKSSNHTASPINLNKPCFPFIGVNNLPDGNW